MEENKYSVYRHINKINGKQYIGITKLHPYERWGANGRNYSSTPHFYNAIQKYGWDNFEHEILFSGLSKEEACKKEIELIKLYDTQNHEHWYNILSGGNAPIIPDEIRAKMSLAMMGNKNGLGKICSEEKKKKISDAQKGKKLTEEHRANISKAKKGKTHKTISDEAKKKISDAHEKRQVFCLELDKIFPSIQECARQLGIEATTVCACCKGRIKSTHGYHLSYA